MIPGFPGAALTGPQNFYALRGRAAVALANDYRKGFSSAFSPGFTRAMGAHLRLNVQPRGTAASTINATGAWGGYWRMSGTAAIVVSGSGDNRGVFGGSGTGALTVDADGTIPLLLAGAAAFELTATGARLAINAGLGGAASIAMTATGYAVGRFVMDGYAEITVNGTAILGSGFSAGFSRGFG